MVLENGEEYGCIFVDNPNCSISIHIYKNVSGTYIRNLYNSHIIAVAWCKIDIETE